MTSAQTGPGGCADLYARGRAYDAVRAVLSDGHCYERGIAAAREVAEAALTESGVTGLEDMTPSSR